MSNEEILNNNRLIAEFMGYTQEYNVASWEKYNYLDSIDEAIKKYCGSTFVNDGSRFEWFKVSFKDRYYQIWTNQTATELKVNELKVMYRSDKKVIHELYYHTSWNWLMPVVDRIEDSGYFVNICYDICTITYDKQPTIGGHSKLDATYRSIINFIEWYSKQ